jgi:hypothetical protein
MGDKIHNGIYNQFFSVIISSDNHHDCLIMANRIKNLCKAWEFCINIRECKSSRKGDVLKREIQIYQESYSHNIIIFGESLS